MSGYKIHILVYLISILALVFLLKNYNLLELPMETMLLGILIGIPYSILPDIDLPSSVMRKFLGRISIATILVLLIAYLFLKNILLIYISISLALFLYFLWFSRHRGFFHSITAAILFSAPLFLIDTHIAGFALFGYLSHLTIDGKLSLF